jgi:hypothetical protein
MKSKLILYKSKTSGRQKGKWRGKIVAGNGKKLWASTEKYVKHADLIKSAIEARDALNRFFG